MKGKVVSGMLAVIAILALSTTGAMAGAGGIPSPIKSFFVCQEINGDVAGRAVNIQVPFFGLNLRNVKIGSPSLACTFARLFDSGTGTVIEPNPADTREDMKCYAIATSGQAIAPQGIPPVYNAEDAFFPLGALGADVQAFASRYLCAPASFTLAP